jgi:hypothetical protein
MVRVAVDVLGQRDVLGRIRGMPVVEGNVEAVEVQRAFAGIARDEFARRDAFAFRLEHDGRAMRIVGAHEVHGMPRHAHRPHPDVGLDVFQDVAEME